MNCRGDDDIDAKRSRPSIGKTRDGPREERTRAFVWDPISGLHQGQQPKRLHSKAEYMAAPERFAELSDFSLAPRAPSIHGPLRHFAASQNSVAIGGWSQPVPATLYPDGERWSVWGCDKDTFRGSLR